MGFSKKYFREHNRKNREIDKEITNLYRQLQNNPGESYTQFKRRIRKELKY